LWLHEVEMTTPPAHLPEVRLLVADDEPAFTRFVEQVALGLGFEVRALEDGNEVGSVVATWQPHIVILDIDMPGHDGMELLGTLHAQNYSGPIVVLSGAPPAYLQMTGASAKVRGLNLAAVRGKPIRKSELEELLEGLREKA
jgi:DNA-binding response OmpR family regulator